MPSTALLAASCSRRSPSTNSTPCFRASSRYSRRPLDRLSTTRTDATLSSNRSTRCDPMNDVPPVTSVRALVRFNRPPKTSSRPALAPAQGIRRGIRRTRPPAILMSVDLSAARLQRSFQFRLKRILVRAFPKLERAGLHVVAADYASPMPITSDLSATVFRKPSELVGIDMRESEEIAMLGRVTRYKEEYARFP